MPPESLIRDTATYEQNRAAQAELAGDRAAAELHYLAAAYLGQVLAADYARAGAADLAFQSCMQAATCLWKAGKTAEAHRLFDGQLRDQPERGPAIQQVIADLADKKSEPPVEADDNGSALAPSQASQTEPATPPEPAGRRCPDCHARLAPTAVLCIECGYDFRTGKRYRTVHLLGGAEPVGPRWNPREVFGLRLVRIGLGMHYARLLVSCLGVVVLICTGLYVAVSARFSSPDALMLAGMTIGLALLAMQSVLALVGSSLCMLAPDPWARGFVIASLAFEFLAIPVAVVCAMFDWPGALSGLLLVAAWLLFMLGLRRLAYALDRPGIADDVVAIIIKGVAVFVAIPLFLVFLASLSIVGTTPATVVGLQMVIVGLLMIVTCAGWLIGTVILLSNMLGLLDLLRTEIRRDLEKLEEGATQAGRVTP